MNKRVILFLAGFLAGGGTTFAGMMAFSAPGPVSAMVFLLCLIATAVMIGWVS